MFSLKERVGTMELCLELIRYGGVRNKAVKILVYLLAVGIFITAALSEFRPGIDMVLPENSSPVSDTAAETSADHSEKPGIIEIRLPEGKISEAAAGGPEEAAIPAPDHAILDMPEFTKAVPMVSERTLPTDMGSEISALKEDRLHEVTAEPDTEVEDIPYKAMEDTDRLDITGSEPDAAELSVPGTAAPDDPAMTEKKEEAVGPAGFLIDETGMIYGFVPELADCRDGIVVLPSEGCIGIRRGTFLGKGTGIIEIYIPSNITVIEDGALAGLDSLEWIETEGNPNYVSVDGVLFDAHVSVLTAFPNGRTGAYIVPASVVRIADGAFSNPSLSKLDMRACGEVEIGSGNLESLAECGVEILWP